MPDLNLYLYHGIYVAALDVEDACGVIEDERGYDPRSEDPEDLPELLPGGTVVSIWVDEDGRICDEDDEDRADDPLELTADEWLKREAREDGRGFVLCWEE